MELTNRNNPPILTQFMILDKELCGMTNEPKAGLVPTRVQVQKPISFSPQNTIQFRKSIENLLQVFYIYF